MILNGKKYSFNNCPVCGKRRAISPVSGCCWLCGGHDTEIGLSEVDPDLKQVLDDLDKKMQLETDPKELINLILLAEKISEQI